MIINNIKYHKTKKSYFKYEPIKWRVIQSENEEAFLLSDVILDKQAYGENEDKQGYITWEESSLRAWLNEKFMNRAFSDEEKEKLRKYLEENTEINPETGKLYSPLDTTDWMLFWWKKSKKI